MPVALSAVVMIMGMCAVASDDTTATPALREDILFLARGLEQSAFGAIQQVSGRATVRIQRNGDIFRQFDFYVDGEKKRWDMWLNKPDTGEFTLVSKQAFDGSAFYEFRYLMDGKPYPIAHVREPEQWIPAGQSTYTGMTCDPRMFWLPRELAKGDSVVRGLEVHLRKGSVKVLGDIKTDKMVTLVVTKDTTSHGVLEVQVDIEITSDGCIARRLQRFQDGQLIGRCIRDYERHADTGLLVLTHCRDEAFAKGREALHEYTVVYESINQSLPADTFTLLGFNLPFGTTIADTRIGGIKYKYGGDSKDIERALSDVVRLEAQGMQGISDTGKSTITQDGHENMQDNVSPQGAEHNRTSMGKAMRPLVWWAVAAAIGAIVVVGIITARARKNRPAQ